MRAKIMKSSLGFAILMLAGAAAAVANPVRPDHPIIGTWLHETGSCISAHTHRSDGTMHATSGEEVSDATYEISDQPDVTGAYTLTITTLGNSNAKPDCWGAVTPTGYKETYSQSARFNRAADQLELCGSNGTISYCAGFHRAPKH